MYVVKTLIKAPVGGKFEFQLYVLPPKSYDEARDYAEKLVRGMTSGGYKHFESDDTLHACLRLDNTTVYIKIEEE